MPQRQNEETRENKWTTHACKDKLTSKEVWGRMFTFSRPKGYYSPLQPFFGDVKKPAAKETIGLHSSNMVFDLFGRLWRQNGQKNSCFVYDSLFGRRNEEVQIEIGWEEEKRYGNRIGGWRPPLVARKYFLMSERHWKLINIVFILAKLGNICSVSGKQKCFWLQAKTFFVSGKQNLF